MEAFFSWSEGPWGFDLGLCHPAFHYSCTKEARFRIIALLTTPERSGTCNTVDIGRLRKNFGAKIARPAGTPCHIWQGSFRGRYGLCWADGGLKTATHVAWFLEHGTWPTQHVLHRCDNPPCVNPDHLFEGSDQDNADDRNSKLRHSFKLDYLARQELLALAARGLDRCAAEAFGVHATTVGQIRKRTGLIKDRKGERFDVNGEWLTVEEIAARAAVAESTIRHRLENGLSGTQLLAPRHAAPRKPYIRKT